MLTVRYEPERSREPDFGDVVPVRVEDEGEVPVEGDPRPRWDLAAVSAAEGGLDERGDVLSLDLREQVQVLVITSGNRFATFSRKCIDSIYPKTRSKSRFCNTNVSLLVILME